MVETEGVREHGPVSVISIKSSAIVDSEGECGLWSRVWMSIP